MNGKKMLRIKHEPETLVQIVENLPTEQMCRISTIDPDALEHHKRRSEDGTFWVNHYELSEPE